jgi:hypothetical protein
MSIAFVNDVGCLDKPFFISDLQAQVSSLTCSEPLGDSQYGAVNRLLDPPSRSGYLWFLNPRRREARVARNSWSLDSQIPILAGS